MFGDVVKERRLARGWSQQQLADAVGVSAPYISMIETKKRGQEPGYDTLVLMAETFDTTVEELRSAANRDAPFPTDELIAEGLKADIAQILATQWEAAPMKRRTGILTMAKKLARDSAEVDRKERQIRGEQVNPDDKTDVH
jgi:transcriptional regulator with XRE-family HTH domain